MYRNLGRVALIKTILTIVRFLWIATGVIVWTMALALVSMISGVPETMNRTAEMWERKFIIENGLPTIHKAYYFHTSRIIAILFVFFGWVCFSFATVFLVMWIVR